ncbi:MAG: type III pantothenate kinase, partial [Metamycoplasmataceae bacterium]
MKKKSNFYISIGNTRTTFAIFDESINDIKTIKKYTKEMINYLNDVLDELDINPLKIFVCSVTKKYNSIINNFFQNKEIIYLNHSNQNIIDFNSLDIKNEIGNDMIASAIYAQSIGKNTVVVSLGTATTISAIVEKTLMGCIILPGLQIS